jgi:hypothetical protein
LEKRKIRGRKIISGGWKILLEGVWENRFYLDEVEKNSGAAFGVCDAGGGCVAGLKNNGKSN